MIPDKAIEAAALALYERDHIKGVALGDVRRALEAAAPHIGAQEDRKLVNTWYRSLTPDGLVWCESRDPEEVKQMSKGKNCTFEKYEIYEVATGWKPWGK